MELVSKGGLLSRTSGPDTSDVESHVFRPTNNHVPKHVTLTSTANKGLAEHVTWDVGNFDHNGHYILFQLERPTKPSETSG